MSLPGGTFTMGSPSSEFGRNADEAPHEVAVAPFFIGEHEVTQREWREAMGANPSHFADCGDDCPVEEVNFYDVADYLAKLTARSSDVLAIACRPKRNGSTRAARARRRRSRRART